MSIFSKIPFADTFRLHTRMMPFALFLNASLAGIGLSYLWERRPLRLSDAQTRRLNLLWVLLVAYIVGITGATLLFPGGIPVFSATPLMVLLPCILVGILASFSTLPSWAKETAVWAVVLAVLFDVASHKYLPNAYPPPADKMNMLRSVISRSAGWAKENAGYDRVFLNTPIRDPNAGSAFRVPNINSYVSFTLARWNNFVRYMIGAEKFDSVYHARTFYGDIDDNTRIKEWFLRRAPMAGMASLRYLVTHKPAREIEFLDENPTVWKPIYESDGVPTFCVYENTFALPRTYLVNSYILTQSEEESLQAIGVNISILTRSVVLENGAPSFPSTDVSMNPGEVRIKKYGTNEVELEVAAKGPSLAVLTDIYYPGWNAYVDGVRKPIWRANSLFRAVEVPLGSHTIIFRYQPASLRWGALISLSSFFLILFGSLLAVMRKGKGTITEKIYTP